MNKGTNRQRNNDKIDHAVEKISPNKWAVVDRITDEFLSVRTTRKSAIEAAR